MAEPAVARLAVAGGVFALALDGGSYALESRHSLAIVLWWTLALGLGVGLLPLASPTRATLATGALLAGLAAFTGASLTWALSAEKAFLELDRVLLYAGVFAFAAATSSRRAAPRWCDGIALGVTGVAAVALMSRFFPGVVSDRSLAAVDERLSFPVGYWTGLAVLLALGTPFLLRLALIGPGLPLRGIALAPLPAYSAAVYLASSRGGGLAVAVAAVTFVLSCGRPCAALGAVLVAGIGSAAAIAVLLARPEIVDGPLDSTAALSQGRSAAVLIGLICLATGLVYAVGYRASGGSVRPGSGSGARRWAAMVIATLVLAGVAAAGPDRVFQTFTRPPGEAAQPHRSAASHLLSADGSGRWQFWQAALDSFETNPVAGRGAGSYEAWWAEHGSVAYFVRDAHSLYLEVLGELGVVGLALLGAAFGVGLAVGFRSLAGSGGAHRASLAALSSAFLAFVVAAGIDWMWELTVVSVIGIACLGVLMPAAAAPLGNAAAPSPRGGRRLARAAAVAACLFVIAFELLPLLARLEIDSSQAAVARGDLMAARASALAAHDLEPWATSPLLQLALVEEQRGRLGAARAAVREAISRDPGDWRLWLVSARLATKSGSITEARRALEQAAALNPRSPLFAALR